MAHLLGILVAGVAAGTLGREAPAPQVQADRPHGQGDPALLADQVADGAAAPQRGGDAPLLGGVAAEQALDEVGLLLGEEAPGTEGAPGAPVGEGVQAPVGISGPPAADGFAADAQEVRDLGLGEPQFTATQGPQADGFQDVIRQLTGVR